MDSVLMRYKVLILLILALIAVHPVSAAYNKTFDSSSIVIANQSIVQDPTGGTATPWVLWILSGIIGLALVIMALTRARTQRMDYETNIILSILAWPFCWYFTWSNFTSIDYIAGVGITTTGNATVMMTQHILYSFWVLGWVGVVGCVFAVFVTALLASQYELFKENEGNERAERQKQKQEM